MAPSWIGALILAIVVGALGFYFACKAKYPEMGRQAFKLETAIRRNGLSGLDYQQVLIHVRDDGAVSLEGVVELPVQKDAAEAAAKGTPGVTGVVNNIRLRGGG